MKKLENKVAVITGGNSGIGLSTAILFAKHGAQVAITGRDNLTIQSALKQIGNDALGIVSDVTEVSKIDASYKQVSDKFGKIDVLIINAGVYLGAPLADFTEEQFDLTSDINFKGVFFSIQKALPYLNDGASIVITSSAVAEIAMPTAAAYSASKAAVNSLAKTFSLELADRKIRVNLLSPGPIVTPIFSRSGATEEEVANTQTAMAGLTVVGRLGNVVEVAEGFLYLASDDSRFMVGSELLLDGGVRLK